MMHAVRYIALKLSPFCLISKQLVSNLPQASRISKSLYRWMFRYWRMKKTTWSKTTYEIFTDHGQYTQTHLLLVYFVINGSLHSLLKVTVKPRDR